ncbi:CusA/CzcA family heavy metal efflux RND transporter [Methylocella sp. CPCC 101449]|jgi:cobalt-zinc-cadmium resistance protein CzcA|uniref:efflux RND transporter permease subunit n=1 Tax=Methylocella sp. CPCC 101449 TaxID=2987531 RepID=UPI00288F0B68|nr:CusA/CzcA family heavy metal efflux RND transporter [Methylocella sp. CPCC 101449]MDT2023988.1 CusA/CzcA family heavy metal efflux RND transporter [Methylocella sp. CPCC 101449]HEV2573470.1 CusA/CzcA family heavy metal efflux RND transporter [Beijerinckiaceae bacterium]
MINRIIAFSVHQRWLILLLTFLACAFGAWSLSRLPIDAVPDITNNQVQVNAVAPALSPIDMERQVTFPIETAFAGIPGLEYTRSLSRNGFAQVTAVFSEKTDIYFARQQIGERLTEAKETLPVGTEVRVGPISTGLGEIYMWTVHYKDVKPDEIRNGSTGFQSDGSYLTPEGARLTTELEKTAYLRTLQDWVIRPQLRNVPGVAGVDTIGGFEKQFHIQPDPAKLNSFGLSFSDLTEAVQANNASRGAGYIERNGEGYVVRSGGRLETMDDIRDVVISTRKGVPVRVRDVADVSIGRELRTGSASENGKEVVVGTALMLIGGNSRTVSAAVDKKVNEIRTGLPSGIEIQTVLNRTLLVDATVKTVAKNLSEGALLVILVLFLMLGNFRAAFITALVIPIAMLMTATGMLQGRISANLMSLGALDFGLIVDGAVIIAENSLRHLAERQHQLGRALTRSERMDTVIASAGEMVKPSVYGQAIIILVYVPLLTFTGVEGKMFEPMALTVIIALVAAFVLSLTFIPAAIAIFLSRPVEEKDNRIVRTFKSAYRPALMRALAKPGVTIIAAMLLFVGAMLMLSRLGQEFIPQLDEKNIAMHAIRIPSTALTQSQDMQLAVEKTVSTFPEVAFVFSKTGTAEIAADPMPPNTSDTFIILKPQADWPDPSEPKESLVARIKQAVERLPGNNYEFTQPIQMRFNELLAGVRGDIAVKVFGDDFTTLLRTANQVATILRQVPGAQDVRVEQAAGLPFLEINVDKSQIARVGLSLGTVHGVIGSAIGGERAGVVFEGDRRFPIIVRLPDSARQDIAALENLPVPLPVSADGARRSILLKQLASFTLVEGQNQISRENGKRRVVVTANVRGRDIASVVHEARAQIEQKVQVPSGYWVTWGGQFENLAAAQQRLMIVVPACFFLIFILLFSALRSVRDALLVFSAVPLALTGGIAALWLRDMPLSVSAAVGFIALSGIAVLNSLVMLTFIRQLVEEGKSISEAIYEGAMTRLRPVAMTALVASLGFVPMALATGTGAEVQRPIATVVIGGLISATLLTLLVLPALYSRFGRVTAKEKPTDETPPRPSETEMNMAQAAQ